MACRNPPEGVKYMLRTCDRNAVRIGYQNHFVPRCIHLKIRYYCHPACDKPVIAEEEGIRINGNNFKISMQLLGEALYES